MHLNEGLDECLVKALVIACLQKLYTTKRKNNVLTGRLACWWMVYLQSYVYRAPSSADRENAKKYPF